MKTLSNKKICFTLLPKFLVLGFILVFGAIFLPYSVFASNVYIDSSRTDFFVGDTILFNIRVDSEGKNINAIEGEVLIDDVEGAVSLTNINTSGSIFSLWPDQPLPSESNTYVSFAGGSPGGFVSKDTIVFNIVLKLHKPGQITLSPNNIIVYLNDGKGTKDEISVEGLTVNVSPKKPDALSADDWSSIILNDKTPPEPFEIYLGQDESIFDGKKFLSFVTTDKQSGIAYYEVTENDLPPVRSGNTYVLKEQNKSVSVTVIAYDSAGNTKESVYYTITSPNYVVYIVSLVIIIFTILIVFILRKMRKTKNGFTKK